MVLYVVRLPLETVDTPDNNPSVYITMHLTSSVAECLELYCTAHSNGKETDYCTTCSKERERNCIIHSNGKGTNYFTVRSKEKGKTKIVLYILMGRERNKKIVLYILMGRKQIFALRFLKEREKKTEKLHCTF